MQRRSNELVQSQLRRSFTAALLVQSSVLANLLCVMQISKMSKKTKYKIFNPFNLSAKEPCMQKYPTPHKAV